jgi:hypothetical protein
MVDTFAFFLSYDQCRYKPFDIINSRFRQPINNNCQDLLIRPESAIKSRSINEDHGTAIIGMYSSYSSNLCGASSPAMAYGVAV